MNLNEGFAPGWEGTRSGGPSGSKWAACLAQQQVRCLEERLAQVEAKLRALPPGLIRATDGTLPLGLSGTGELCAERNLAASSSRPFG